MDIRSDHYYGSNNANQLNIMDAAIWTAAIPGTQVYSYQTGLVDAVVNRIGDRPNVVDEVCNENSSGGPRSVGASTWSTAAMPGPPVPISHTG